MLVNELARVAWLPGDGGGVAGLNKGEPFLLPEVATGLTVGGGAVVLRGLTGRVLVSFGSSPGDKKKCKTVCLVDRVNKKTDLLLHCFPCYDENQMHTIRKYCN